MIGKNRQMSWKLAEEEEGQRIDDLCETVLSELESENTPFWRKPDKTDIKRNIKVIRENLCMSECEIRYSSGAQYALCFNYRGNRVTILNVVHHHIDTNGDLTIIQILGCILASLINPFVRPGSSNSEFFLKCVFLNGEPTIDQQWSQNSFKGEFLNVHGYHTKDSGLLYKTVIKSKGDNSSPQIMEMDPNHTILPNINHPLFGLRLHILEEKSIANALFAEAISFHKRCNFVKFHVALVQKLKDIYFSMRTVATVEPVAPVKTVEPVAPASLVEPVAPVAPVVLESFATRVFNASKFGMHFIQFI